MRAWRTLLSAATIGAKLAPTSMPSFSLACGLSKSISRTCLVFAEYERASARHVPERWRSNELDRPMARQLLLGNGMKATELLTKQHEEVARLFKAIESAKNSAEKRALFQELASNLCAHDS